MIARFPDWQVRLAAYLDDVEGRAFAYGRLDCALFAAGAVKAMTGDDLARGWRGYRSRAAGLRNLRGAGHDDHVALAASLLPEIAVAQAGPGDVAVIDGEAGPALCIFQGRMIYAVTLGGLGLVPRSAAVRAFKV